MTQASEKVHDNNYSLRATKVLIVGADGNSSGPGGITGSYQVTAKGTVGTNLDVTPTEGDQVAYEMLISAPFADDDATLVIYKDSVSGGNVMFNGYLANRDNGKIYFPGGESCTTKWIVVVTGGSGDLFVLARHS